ncbi:MAG: hypothetical protein JWQ27_1177 [Ferruginibacter sp.]|nr:hypothetical protein [Ferruginibacter sp.]
MKSTLPNLVGKSMILLLCCTLFFTRSYSQHLMFGGEKLKVEAGLNFGPTFFLGDLGGNRGKGTGFIKDVNLSLTKMMKGAFVTVYPTSWIGVRVAAQLTYISGEDNIISTHGVDELWRKERNLDFKSNMWEAYGAIEIYPTMLFRKYDDYDPLIKPYGFIGVGIFHFNPQGSLTTANGVKTWYDLQPLRTEGQGMKQYPDRKEYKLTQMNIPMGMGVRIALSPRISTGMELLYRKTFTDYIDDVSTTYIDPKYFDQYLTPANASIARKIHDKTVGIVNPGLSRYAPGTQRGNAKNDDSYFSFVAKLGIRLGYTNEEDRRTARQSRCPAFY